VGNKFPDYKFFKNYFTFADHIKGDLQTMVYKILDTPIEYLPGVGPMKADVLKKELQIFNYRDLLYHFPFRYVDKTRFHRISDINEESDTVQLKGILRRLEVVGDGRVKRLSGTLRDETGSIELVWFQMIHFLEKSLSVGGEYIVYGRVNWFGTKVSLPHPEMELATPEKLEKPPTFDPVYTSTTKLDAKGLDAKGQRKLLKTLFEKLKPADITENLSEAILQRFKLAPPYQALYGIHFPENQAELDWYRNRLKFEELFFLQMKLLQAKKIRKDTIRGHVFEKIGDYFNKFFNEILPFELTNAQKRVLKEIRRDLGAGIQMNRLLQGDVGSGKTVVAFMSMLIALDNGFQAMLMAPTEILAQQHFDDISRHCEKMDIKIAFLSGSIKGKKREEILRGLAAGETQILIGTHAIFEDWVVFQNLALAITDEQHRFGVEQRGKLWKKSKPYPPHVLVMSATPIPRTLAMTLYGDLDVSVIDELPVGRKPIRTEHRTENHRLRVIGFMREEIAKGRQIYVVYPLIEESEKLDLLNLMEGHESLSRDFPMPEYQISIVHGKMPSKDKDFEMQRFIKHETQIMVATTVIEVGVNVPNASVMVIEHAERFGLSQLHQLRGRVGRGAEQSFCILMSSFKVSRDGKERIQTMCRTTDGFEIAEADLKLRGPGDIQGTAQSGLLNLHIADLAKDGKILQAARHAAIEILDNDPTLALPEHICMKNFMEINEKQMKVWGRIS
jgi:ATP-dependent DNA helicase RecG